MRAYYTTAKSGLLTKVASDSIVVLQLFFCLPHFFTYRLSQLYLKITQNLFTQGSSTRSMVVLANRCATARAAQIWQANRVSKLLITTCGQQKARSTTMSKGFSEAERQIVTALIETN